MIAVIVSRAFHSSVLAPYRSTPDEIIWYLKMLRAVKVLKFMQDEGLDKHSKCVGRVFESPYRHHSFPQSLRKAGSQEKSTPVRRQMRGQLV